MAAAHQGMETGCAILLIQSLFHRGADKCTQNVGNFRALLAGVLFHSVKRLETSLVERSHAAGENRHDHFFAGFKMIVDRPQIRRRRAGDVADGDVGDAAFGKEALRDI